MKSWEIMKNIQKDEITQWFYNRFVTKSHKSDSIKLTEHVIKCKRATESADYNEGSSDQGHK